MGKKQKAKNINRAFNKQCPNDKYICPHLLKPDDIPTQFAGLGIRSVFAIFGWVALGFKMEGSAVFNSLFLYFAPLLLDYLRFKPVTKKRKILRIWGLLFSGLFLAISFFGFFRIIDAINVNNTTRIVTAKDFIGFKFLNVDFLWIWRIVALAPATTIIDYFAYRTPAEKILVNKECVA